MIELTNSKKLYELILISGNNKSNFAKKIGVSPATITFIFKNKRATPHVAKLIIDELNVDFNEIFEVKELKEA
ncbi:XRE family transcriptional regulator [Staphylococcus capitis]|uniref:XRE family transcriptional regulator n=2 Tax=Staphylococcus capitis TaxID=29388 RepID=A0A7Z7YUW3_STACP|nr:helix-turn-helix transcriptional regulator [Staphylococcus capitis]MDW3920339.1 helix-turn-helix transcriptional regulator [Staphylococcus saprophyticus]BAT22907.1 putative transcriptional regulator [Staphylococcus capitis subsp. urealyticus]MBU5292096.1 helix-turn-helix domain-containing protein [Staphylococcus capitis]MDS4004625.1 helix-turn-helix transcriptional regulator [Staphylococcus capitis]MDZ5507539.1 helix-turn-helix transcriptional regulator [Staphylococcus capitis]